MMKNKNQFDKFYKTIEKFLIPLTLEKTYEIIIKEGVKLTGAKYGSILLRKNSGFHRVYSTAPFNPNPIKKGFAYEAYRSGKLKIVKRNQFVLHHPEIKKTDIEYFAFVPLTHQK